MESTWVLPLRIYSRTLTRFSKEWQSYCLRSGPVASSTDCFISRTGRRTIKGLSELHTRSLPSFAFGSEELRWARVVRSRGPLARSLLLKICFFEVGNPGLGGGSYELEVGQMLESRQPPSLIRMERASFCDFATPDYSRSEKEPIAPNPATVPMPGRSRVLGRHRSSRDGLLA